MIHWTHPPSLYHLVFQPHQYLSKCIGGLKVNFHPISIDHSSQLLRYSFHILDHNWVSLLGFVQDMGAQLQWSLQEHLALPDSVLGPGSSLPPRILLVDLVEVCLPPPVTTPGNDCSVTLA